MTPRVSRTLARPSQAGGAGVLRNCRGLGLFEVMAGALVATIAVLGLAYSFGVGRGLVDRYQIARTAMGRARLVIDSLAVEVPSAVRDGSQDFWFQGRRLGTTLWRVEYVDDPLDRLASSSPPDPNPRDLKRLVVKVGWRAGSSTDTLRLTRLMTGS